MEITRTGKIALIGYVNGTANYEKKDADGKPAREIMKKISTNGKKYQVFELSISKKNDNSVNKSGKDYFSFKVTYFSENLVNEGDYIGIVLTQDFFNIKNKEGKYVSGLNYTAFEGDLFEPEEYFNSLASTKKDSKEDSGAEEAWNA